MRYVLQTCTSNLFMVPHFCAKKGLKVQVYVKIIPEQKCNETYQRAHAFYHMAVHLFGRGSYAS